jgi:hypothetical protein
MMNIKSKIKLQKSPYKLLSISLLFILLISSLSSCALITQRVAALAEDPSDVATLSGITVNGVSVSDFDPATLSYVFTVEYDVTVIEVVATATDGGADVVIAKPVVVDDGLKFVITVTAEDDKTTEEYVVIVNREDAPKSSVEYVVHYYLQGTSEKLDSDKVLIGQVGSTVTETAPSFVGYTADAPTKSSELVATEADNVITFYYTLNVYDIIYILNDGENHKDNPVAYTIVDTPITLLAPTKSGYNFVAWAEGDTIAEGATGAKTFTAQWSSVAVVCECELCEECDGCLEVECCECVDCTPCSCPDVVVCECEKCDVCQGCVADECCECVDCTPCSCETKLSDDATLSLLSVNPGVFSAEFTSEITSYTVDVANEVYSVTISAVANDENAIVSGDVGVQALVVGVNVFTIVVTAQDGETTQTYTVTVNRDEAGFFSGSGVMAVAYWYVPTTSSSVTMYAFFAEELTTDTGEVVSNGLYIVVEHAGRGRISESVVSLDDSEISFTGSEVHISTTLAFPWGANSMNHVITLDWVFDSSTVLSEDGYTDFSDIWVSAPGTFYASDAIIQIGDGTGNHPEVYESDWAVVGGITPELLSDDATLSMLSVNPGVFSADFTSEVTGYSVTVANSVSSITISAVANDENAVVSGDGTFALNVGVNTFAVVVTAQDGETTQTYTVTVNRAAPSGPTVKIGGLDIPLTIGKDGIPTIYWAELTEEQQNAILKANGKEVSLVKDARGNILSIALMKPVISGSTPIAKITVK